MCKRRLRNLALFALIAIAAPLAGCYSHVVRASGPGSEQHKIYESNRDNIVLGEWFGEKPSQPAPGQ